MTDALDGPLTHWHAPRPPERQVLAGRRVRLEPLDPARHGRDLFDAAQGSSADPNLWRYLFDGPFAGYETFLTWLEGDAATADPLFFAIVDQATGHAVGMASYMRITPAHGVIEIGYIWFGPTLQRTPGATEAIYLLARHAFDDLGYRRLEWKCDAQNARSRRAAVRFGFQPEGVFRQHMVVKGRNRDTAWFAMTDGDWPRARAAFERWLDPANFDEQGHQRQTLEEMRAAR